MSNHIKSCNLAIQPGEEVTYPVNCLFPQVEFSPTVLIVLKVFFYILVAKLISSLRKIGTKHVRK